MAKAENTAVGGCITVRMVYRFTIMDSNMCKMHPVREDLHSELRTLGLNEAPHNVLIRERSL